MKFFWLLIFPLLFYTCMPAEQKLDVQGHRGCRGHYPENSIEGFLAALEMGVSTLEMDVVISKDHKVVVSHEPWINPDICLTANSDNTQPKEQNLYQLDYRQIREFDCGSKTPDRFPRQKSISTYKPLLSEVLDTLLAYTRNNQIPLIPINLETKIRPEGDHLYHPNPKIFFSLVWAVLNKKQYLKATTLQSFDVRTLKESRKKDPSLPIALLIDRNEKVDEKLERLGFKPDILSPEKSLVDKQFMAYAEKYQLKVIPWTVNEPEEIQRLIELDVDGMISDYPDRVLNTME